MDNKFQAHCDEQRRMAQIFCHGLLEYSDAYRIEEFKSKLDDVEDIIYVIKYTSSSGFEVTVLVKEHKKSGSSFPYREKSLGWKMNLPAYENGKLWLKSAKTVHEYVEQIVREDERNKKRVSDYDVLFRELEGRFKGSLDVEVVERHIHFEKHCCVEVVRVKFVNGVKVLYRIDGSIYKVILPEVSREDVVEVLRGLSFT
jgi:hypothetical protein